MAALVVMPLPPLWMQNETYSADTFRTATDALLFPGVTTTAGLKVGPRTAGANLSVDVAPGSCAIEAATGTRTYLCTADAVTNLTVNAAPGSNSRVDLVVAEIRDTAVDGGPDSDWVLRVITGTVAALPAPPPVPSAAIELARVFLTAGNVSVQNSAITDRRSSALPVTVATSTTRPALARAGHLVTEADTGNIQIGSGTSWQMFGGDISVADINGSLFGGTPPPEATASRKMIFGNAPVTFSRGKGVLVLPYTFTGIVSVSLHSLFSSEADGTFPLNVQILGFGPEVMTGKRIPITGHHGLSESFSTTVIVYQVFGW